MFTFAHLSDLHLSPLPRPEWRQLTAKRGMSYVNWHKGRKHRHRPEVLAALKDDLALFTPDHLAVTGDLTNLGLEAEIDAAARYLEALAPEEMISLVPGNHDAYTAASAAMILERWRRWMGDGFPYLHRRGPVSFIGICSGVPTGIGRATGAVGADQLIKLEALLAVEGTRGRYRVVLIHHPPQEGAAPAHKHLDNRKEFRAALARSGAELVLHGHMHEPLQALIPGPHEAIRVLGVGSASTNGSGHHSPGHYHRLSLGGQPGSWRLEVEHRQYDPRTGLFTGMPEGDILRESSPAV